MYTIKQASIRSGVAINTIRAWERRYGVVRPARTGSGYRLYDEGAIRKLDVMRRLVAAGWQPSVAAREVETRGVDAMLDELSPGPQAAATPQAGTEDARVADRGDEAERLSERFVAAAAALDESAVTAVLDDVFSRGSFERVASEILFPALESLGEAWSDGRVSVAGEHLASHIVHRRLGQLLEAAGPGPSARRRVLVGLPPGSRHELGALAFAIVARRAGLPVAYLGADLPVADWHKAAANARAAVIGVPTAADREAAASVAAELNSSAPDVIVALGGVGAVDLPRSMRLPPRLEESVAALKRALVAR